MDAWPCVKDLQTLAGREAALEHALWPGGPKLGDLPGDALPNMVPLTVTDDTLHTVWDLLFTDYDPQLWPKLLKPREGQTFFDERPRHPGASSGSGVRPGPRAGGSGAGSGSGAPGSSSGSGLLPGPKAGGSEAGSGSGAGQRHAPLRRPRVLVVLAS